MPLTAWATRLGYDLVSKFVWRSVTAVDRVRSFVGVGKPARRPRVTLVSLSVVFVARLPRGSYMLPPLL